MSDWHKVEFLVQGDAKNITEWILAALSENKVANYSISMLEDKK